MYTYHLSGNVCVILQSEVSPSQSYADQRKAKQSTSHSLPLNREEFPWQHRDISTCVSNGGPSLDVQYVNISKGSNLGHLPRQISFNLLYSNNLLWKISLLTGWRVNNCRYVDFSALQMGVFIKLHWPSYHLQSTAGWQHFVIQDLIRFIGAQIVWQQHVSVWEPSSAGTIAVLAKQLKKALKPKRTVVKAFTFHASFYSERRLSSDVSTTTSSINCSWYGGTSMRSDDVAATSAW